LTEIPRAIRTNLINLRSLKIINLNLSKLVNRTFINFRKLEQLTIQKSQIKSIEIDAFYSLANLRYLNLDQNHLDDSSWTSLTQHLIHLENLSLNQNHFHRLHASLSKSLKQLDLSSNGLQQIDKKLDETLEKLDLQNNELNSLQLSFLSSLKNLKELNLDFNRLTFLPEKIFQFNSQLNYLSLQGNDLNFLTNSTFIGLDNLLHLNLARNRLQFLFNHRPFQYFRSLKILNLDRNLQMNLTKFILDDLNETLVELSLQNCNLTEWTDSFDSFRNLQRLRFSSNSLKNLPRNFLSSSILSLDLQRNQFDRLPYLIERNSSKLIDLDLSSNQISTLNTNDLFSYPNLKTIGLTNNPLNCDCHLKWIQQWLIDNYDRDLIRFLQWTCAKPNELVGRQLTTIRIEDMRCDDEQIQTVNIRNELILDHIEYKSNGQLIVSWKDFRLIQSEFYHIKIYDEKREFLLFDRLIANRKHSIEINEIFPSIINICIDTSDKSICRKVILPSNIIQSASMISSFSSSNEQQQFIYLILGLLVGAIIICTILILICYYHLQSFRKQQATTKTCLYHSLTHSQPQHESNHTSECSLHSSTDITEPYHIYQSIYPTRTRIYI